MSAAFSARAIITELGVPEIGVGSTLASTIRRPSIPYTLQYIYNVHTFVNEDITNFGLML